jgi:hypothetical protein
VIPAPGQQIRLGARAGSGVPLLLCNGGHVYIQECPECEEVQPTEKRDDCGCPNHAAKDKLCRQRAK